MQGRSGVACRLIRRAMDSWTGLNWPAYSEPLSLNLQGLKAERLRRAAEAARRQKDLSAAVQAAEKVLGRHLARRRLYSAESLARWLDAAAAEVADAETDARLAASFGRLALELLERGNYAAALEKLEHAEALERTYGDSPAYGPAVDAVADLVREAGN